MSKGSRWEEIIKTIPESNEIESSKITEKINETKSCSLEKINTIVTPLTRLIRKKRQFSHFTHSLSSMIIYKCVV